MLSPFPVELQMTRIGRARIPVMTCCFLSICHSRHVIVNIFQTVFLDSYLCQITRFQILSWCYQQHLGVIISQLLQNVTSHEAQASPHLISGMEQNISVLFGSDTIFNLFPRKWKQGVGSSRGGAQRGWGVWALNTEHFNVSRYCHNEFLSVGCQQKRTLGTGALWTEFKVLTGWHEELLS